MKRITLRFAIASVTFLAGVAAASLWLYNQSCPVPEIAAPLTECIPFYDPSVLPKEYGNEERASMFAAFREPPLQAMPRCVDESYRLTWVPSFHSPVVVRVWRSGNNHYMVAKRLSGRGGYEMGSLSEEQARPLSVDEWHNLMNLSKQASFWQLPSNINEVLPNDGAAWMIEGLKNQKYHYIHRRTPSAQVNGVSKYLIKLTGLETGHDLYLPAVPPNKALKPTRNQRAS